MGPWLPPGLLLLFDTGSSMSQGSYFVPLLPPVLLLLLGVDNYYFYYSTQDPVPA